MPSLQVQGRCPPHVCLQPQAPSFGSLQCGPRGQSAERLPQPPILLGSPVPWLPSAEDPQMAISGTVAPLSRRPTSHTSGHLPPNGLSDASRTNRHASLLPPHASAPSRGPCAAPGSASQNAAHNPPRQAPTPTPTFCTCSAIQAWSLNPASSCGVHAPSLHPLRWVMPLPCLSEAPFLACPRLWGPRASEVRAAGPMYTEAT